MNLLHGKTANAMRFQILGTLSVLMILLVFSPSLYGQDEYLIEPQNFKQTIDKKPKNVILIDVRTLAEYNEARIEGSINIDIESDYFKDSIATLDKTQVYFLYCKAGTRSSRARDVMKEAKFPYVFELDGGLEDWLNQEFPVVTSKENN